MHLFWKRACLKALRWDAFDRLVVLSAHERFRLKCFFVQCGCSGCLVSRGCRIIIIAGFFDLEMCFWSGWFLVHVFQNMAFVFIKEPILLRLKIHLKLNWKELLVVAFRWQWLKRHIFKKHVVYHIIVSVSNPQSVYYDIWDRVFDRPSIVQMNSDYAAVALLTEMQCHMTYWFSKVLIIQEGTFHRHHMRWWSNRCLW